MAQAIGLALPQTTDGTALARKPRGYWQRVGRRLRYDYVTLFFLAVIALILVVAIFAPVLAPFDPNKTSIALSPQTGFLSQLPSRHRRAGP